jgi:hypothetical protein
MDSNRSQKGRLSSMFTLPADAMPPRWMFATCRGC